MEKSTGYITTNDGVRICYEDIGQGKPLVFLGGWRMSKAWWRKQVPELSKKYRLILMDMRGYGDSDKPASGHRVARHAKDLYDLIEALDLRDVTPVAWSMGASTIMSYVDLFGSHKLAKAVFVDQTPKVLSDDEWKWGLGEGVFTLPNMEEWIAGVRADDEAFVKGFVSILFTPENTAKLTDEERAWMAAESLKIPTEMALAVVQDHLNQDWRSMLPKIDIPLLVVTGKQSQVFPYQSSVYITEQVPNAKLALFENSGHCPFYEEPEKFNAAVIDFVG